MSRREFPYRVINAYWGCLSVALLTSTVGFGQENADNAAVAARNLYAQAVDYQKGGQFDLAAEDWENFVEQFPRDPLMDKARHYAGVCRLQLKEYEKAAEHFSTVIQQNPNFELAEEARLNLGFCQFSQGSAGAREMYERA